jgi:DNA polymerase-4
MEVYAAVSRQIRTMMEELTPAVEPLSLDEAFLDLGGTDRLLGGPPALSMARLALAIEREIGVSVSVGLSHNKYLAKIASDLDKPRGFAVIGRAETPGFLADRPVRSIWGVGRALADRLEADGIRTNADLRRAEVGALVARYGRIGRRLHELASGIDSRRVEPDRPAKSISSETTFDADIGDADRLIGHLWRLAVATSDRAKARRMGGHAVVLKLKTRAFRTVTRQARLPEPTNLAEVIHGAAEPMLLRALGQGPFRLIGVGLAALTDLADAAPPARLFAEPGDGQARAEAATDRIRGRYGKDAIIRGRALR